MPSLIANTGLAGNNLEPRHYSLQPATHSQSFMDVIGYYITHTERSRAKRGRTTKPLQTKPLQKITQHIQQLALTANKDDWDGEGASKLSTKTRGMALGLVDSLPSYVLENDIDIDVTPFGSIDFGWVLERNVMMNILVLSSGEIAFAYSIGGKAGSGKELWKGVLSPCISEIFNKVFNRQRLDG